MRLGSTCLIGVLTIGCGRIGFDSDALSAMVDGAAAVDGSIQGDASTIDGSSVEGGFDACVPTAEICNGEDDDCDGRADDEDEGPLCGAGETCVGSRCTSPIAYSWDRTYGGWTSVNAVAVDGAGRIYAAGNFSGTVDFGLGPTPPASNIFVLSLTPEGVARWIRTFGPSTREAADIAVDSAGNVYVIGLATGDTDFGGGIRSIGGMSPTTFILSLSSEGAHRWDRIYPFITARRIAVPGGGGVVALANFRLSIDLGGGLLTSSGGTDVALWRLSPDGSYLWDRTFGGAENDGGSDVAVGDDGSLTMVGGFTGPVDFGGGSRTEPEAAFVLRLTSTGAYFWDQTISGLVFAEAVAVGADANTYVAGSFHGAIDFGGGPRENRVYYDTFVWSLGSDGSYRWDRTVGDDRNQVQGAAVAAGRGGGIVVGGRFASAMDFGGGERSGGAGAGRGFLWGLDTAGEYRWDHVGRGTTDMYLFAVAYGMDGTVVAGGNFSGSINFGGGVRSSDVGPDGFVLKLEPAR